MICLQRFAVLPKDFAPTFVSISDLRVGGSCAETIGYWVKNPRSSCTTRPLFGRSIVMAKSSRGTSSFSPGRINGESRLLTRIIASALESRFRAIDESASPCFTMYSVLRGEGSFEKKICVLTLPRRSRKSRVTGDLGSRMSAFTRISRASFNFPSRTKSCAYFSLFMLG